jgi:hypothetical protein
MRPGQVLNPGNALQNGEMKLTYRQDGALSFDRFNGGNYWNSGTQGSPAGVCVLEEDGNLVIYDPDGNLIWMTGTWGHPDSQLTVYAEGYALLERPAAIPSPHGLKILQVPVWSTSRLLGTVRVSHASGPPEETTLTVPVGRKILCGGARVNSFESDLCFLTASFPKDVRTWVAKAKGSTGGANIDVWAITINDPHNEFDVRIFSNKSVADRFPSTTATVLGNYVLTGGGAEANWHGQGGFLVASFPGSPDSWAAASKTHPDFFETGSVTAYAIGIRTSDAAPEFISAIFEKKMFETKIFPGAETSVSRPSAQISLPGYLVGGGAEVRSGERYFLTASYPEGNAWKVASKEHLQLTKCTINAYAIVARVGSGTL